MPQPPAYSQEANIPQQNFPRPTSTTVFYVNEHQLFGTTPIKIQCPHCQQEIVTKTIFNSGLLTWIAFGICILFGYLFNLY